MKEVARSAGVSTATVSRVLNTPDLVSPETATKVQHAIEKLGYKPNVFAQGLMTRKSRLLGILLPDIHGEFYSELLRGADAEARRRGYHLLISSEARDNPTELFGSSIMGFIAGLAVMITEPNAALHEQARESGLPLVVIDEGPHGDGVDQVMVDNQTGAREAVEHLLTAVPPENCYFVGGPKENYDTAERARVFTETLAKRGTKAAPAQVRFGEYSVEWGRKVGEQLFARRPGQPIGVLAANDEIALGLLIAARDRGCNVPGEVQIIGFDDTRLASLLRPQLSSVRVPMAELGAAAVRALIERVQNPELEGTTTTLPTRLIVRGTSGGG